ncbi:MAG: Fructose dehydrogenase cytochrome subunit [Anaerolineales bacterium]|nr:Fructose dehydrogenase cytochrome subunit [Anaerolineales bacterium]
MKTPLFLLVAIMLAALTALVSPVQAGPRFDTSQVEHGEYIATIAGCTSCHSPYKAEFSEPAALTLDQVRVLAFNDLDATDQTRLMAGGRAFNFGPAGIVFAKNITPHAASGIGAWTDEQIRVAIKTGKSISGDILFPVMPYHVYNSMADADVEAVIAYVRSVPAVENEVPASTVAREPLSALPDKTGIIAPDGSDKAARGAYLVNSVMACTDCHTPTDPSSGAPQMNKYLAGGQPYEGPWGIVYGGNITPDLETGLGSWSEAEIRRALVSGLSRDGRRLILMPWYAYANLTDEDADAIAYYLKNGLEPISNQTPASSLNPDFIVMAESASAPPASPSISNILQRPAALTIAGVLIILIIGSAAILVRRRAG